MKNFRLFTVFCVLVCAKNLLCGEAQVKWEEFTVTSEPHVWEKYDETWTDGKPLLRFDHDTVTLENGELLDAEEVQRLLYTGTVTLENSKFLDKGAAYVQKYDDWRDKSTALQYFKDSPHFRIIGYTKNNDETISATVAFNSERCKRIVEYGPHKIRCDNDTVAYMICYHNFINPPKPK